MKFQPNHKAIFNEVDENNDGQLTKDEQRNHIAMVRDTIGINYRPGPPGRDRPRSPPGRPPVPPSLNGDIPSGRDRGSPPGRPPVPPSLNRDMPSGRDRGMPPGRNYPVPPGKDRPMPTGGHPDPMHNYMPPQP